MVVVKAVLEKVAVRCLWGCWRLWRRWLWAALWRRWFLSAMLVVEVVVGKRLVQNKDSVMVLRFTKHHSCSPEISYFDKYVF